MVEQAHQGHTMLPDLCEISIAKKSQIAHQRSLSQRLLISCFPEWLSEQDVVLDGTMSNVSLLRSICDRVIEPRLESPPRSHRVAIQRRLVRCRCRCVDSSLFHHALAEQSSKLRDDQ